MNFVDVQPASFLDYAWTSPVQKGANGMKVVRTSRKQNRCCDQCRRGKRACDASILEDTLLDGSETSPSGPVVFHYSDVFGSLASCSNCEKTKKTCTFEWLRSQRILQATTPQTASTPLTKKRRKRIDGRNKENTANQARGQQGPQLSCISRPGNQVDCVPQPDPTSLGVTFAGFPCGIDFIDNLRFQNQCDDSQTENLWNLPPFEDGMHTYFEPQRDTPAHEENLGSVPSCHTASSGDIVSNDLMCSLGAGSCEDPKSPRGTRKRRRRSSSTASVVAVSSLAFTNDLLSSTNAGFLADGLLKIYHDSFETHLSCWLTEKTCPYSKDCDVSLPGNRGPDWNRIYHRVFKLDQSPSVRGRLLTMTEDRAASRALNLAIFSFASQWAAPETKRGVKYPFQLGERSEDPKPPHHMVLHEASFGRSLQLNAWHQARKAVSEAADIESFRVVLAYIVFSLTQKPKESLRKAKSSPDREGIHQSLEATADDMIDVRECEDLISKLDLTMNDDGPPLHLEHGLRLIHSLRSRMALTGTSEGRIKKKPRRRKHLQTGGLETADRATVDMLFWLGIMFDTLSSAMHKRPLVVSPEDSDLPTTKSQPCQSHSEPESGIPSDPRAGDSWDELLFTPQRVGKCHARVTWPCSDEDAISLLCEAAPIKVLLFRKVTRIQTLLTRRAPSEKIEATVSSALEIYNHWQKCYSPFLRTCINKHDELPSRIQSWYTCLAGHWHLATILLADLIETIDDTGSGLDSRRCERDSSDFLVHFREENCRSLSDIARCSQKNGLSAQANTNPLSIDQGALLSEPWSDVLVRAFASAAAVLIESAVEPRQSSLRQEDAFQRAEDCIQTLQLLGKRSDKAFAAADLLAQELKLRRQGDDRFSPSSMASAVPCTG